MTADRTAGQYFDPEPAARSAPRTVRLVLPDLTLDLTTDRGVFAAERVDPGTRFLLVETPAPAVEPGGHLLDLGCGYGPIACTLAHRAPEATVWALDVNRRALELCRANAQANGLGNVVVAEPDQVPDDIAFAAIWSNPPIRIGKAALHELLERWLPRLAPGATATLVVQKHLGADSLARWLADADRGPGLIVRRRRSRAGYRLLEVTRT